MASEADILEAMKQVEDPELGVNVVDLGLVYGVDQEDDGRKGGRRRTDPGDDGDREERDADLDDPGPELVEMLDQGHTHLVARTGWESQARGHVELRNP